jgi:prepilin-type N-terminal cleavage/methylation domain-containing protein
MQRRFRAAVASARGLGSEEPRILAQRVERSYSEAVLRTRYRVSHARGFTLVELLAVVIITGVLALVGVMIFRRYITSSKSTEALAVLQAIRAAEESYAAENHGYLNVSTTGGSNPESGTNWYPNVTPNTTRMQWQVLGHPDIANWQLLAPVVTRGVQFGYLVNAGIAGKAMTVLQTANKPAFALPTQDWYVIQAKGDTDGNGLSTLYASTSATAEMYSENEGE